MAHREQIGAVIKSSSRILIFKSYNFYFHSQFQPDPNYSTISVAGESFDLMDGLFNFALSPRKNLGFPLSYEKQDNRFLYFHALASGTENSVPLRIINDASIWEIDDSALSRTFRVIGSRNIQTPGGLMRNFS